eukprot:10592346-Heterocapsa_arctica.AAC.1
MASPEDASLPEPGRPLNLEALIEGSNGTRFGLLSYPVPPMIAARPHFACNPNFRVYATVALLQLQVADSSPLDGSVPTPVEVFYNRSNSPSPHGLEDLTMSHVTLPARGLSQEDLSLASRQRARRVDERAELTRLPPPRGSS